jgi:ParB family chromosome partitioning protein
MIKPNKSQPRTDFDEAAIQSLADSIKENGILQPICVRKCGALYEIISGERRTRAAALAGLTEIPCIIMSVDEEQSAVLALIENIQRKDLSYFEEALAIEKLISVYGLTQENAAKRLGKAQSTIANKLRLLRFSDAERQLLINGNLSERQARAVIRIENECVRKEVLEKIVSKKLNIEQTEQLVEGVLKGKSPVHKKLKTKCFKSIFPAPPRIYMNSLNQIIKRIKEEKIPCETVTNKSDGFYEYIIRFPVEKSLKE